MRPPLTPTQRMTAILDDAQTTALPFRTTDRADVVAYFNACVNSGCGAYERHYGDKNQMATVAIRAALQTWLVVVEAKIAAGKVAE